MKVLLDECVDWRLLRDLPNHEVKTLKQVGWEKIDDGELLGLAARQFDVFITVDKDLPQQQNISGYQLAVIILRAPTTRLPDLRSLVPNLQKALEAPSFGEFQILSWRDLSQSTK
jgi:predicted nuclease of predicted toxin-antitoxin system